MKLYLITSKTKVDVGDTLEASEFVGSQAEAATVRARMNKDGIPRKDITTTAEDWNRNGEPIRSVDERVRLAADIADEAARQMI